MPNIDVIDFNLAKTKEDEYASLKNQLIRFLLFLSNRQGSGYYCWLRKFCAVLKCWSTVIQSRTSYICIRILDDLQA